MIGVLGRQAVIVSCVVASPLLIFVQLVNLLTLFGRSSASKDVELLVLRHEPAVQRKANPTLWVPNWPSTLGDLGVFATAFAELTFAI